jgi:hypothetical protein
MTPEPEIVPEILKIQTTDAPYLSTSQVEAIADLEALRRLETDLRAYADFARACRDFRHAEIFAPAGTADTRARDDKKLACPAVITW